MPELPEVETVCRTLAPEVIGQTFAAARVHWPRTVAPHEPAAFEAAIPGHQVLSVSRRAKLIVFELSNDLVLTTHLRMTGNLRYLAADAEPPTDLAKFLRLEFDFESGDALHFYDIRKFGRVRLYSATEWDAYQSTAFGPEPLDPALDGATFAALLRARRRQVKPLLLDQTFIAGIGNIYADESLYKSRIHPLQLASDISPRKARDLHAAIVETLQAAIANHGTTLRDYRTAFGDAGQNQRELLVYGAAKNAPCRRCGTTLRKIVVGQRGTTYCPRCQRLR